MPPEGRNVQKQFILRYLFVGWLLHVISEKIDKRMKADWWGRDRWTRKCLRKPKNITDANFTSNDANDDTEVFIERTPLTASGHIPSDPVSKYQHSEL